MVVTMHARSSIRESLPAIVLVSILIALPVLTLAASAQRSPAQLEGDAEPRCRLHRSLWALLGSRAPETDVELIVHYDEDVTDGDLARLERAGLDPVAVFDAVPLVYLRTQLARVQDIAALEGVTFIQNNTRLSYQMELTTRVVNATQTWYNRIETVAGDDGTVIDGSGVTAAVVDSGIDAGHPDLDYGEKTIMNLKSDSDLAWYEIENADTSSGHGTHCAGTVAGNGDASGGARRGVAPGANLIGLSTGEAVAIINAYGAMEWVYEHSRPGHNPYNIRVVSNSWGAAGDFYDPEDAISKITEKLTYENNVVVVFAAGNADGDGSGYEGEDGETYPNTNPYANIPSAVSVAAIERDGTGIAEFSSRGLRDVNETFPDIGAPGVSIWSTAARRTLISVMTKDDPSTINPYYFAISGTSMATPHISGVVALLWQVCPQMRTSTVHDDYSGTDTGWWSAPNTRVHEAELILEAAGQYIPPGGEKGAPENGTMHDAFGLRTDFAQGHGLIDTQRAVGIAQTLSELRTMDRNGDGDPDWPEATVRDAVAVYDGKSVRRNGYRFGKSDTLVTDWKGEWTRFNNQSNQLSPWDTDQHHGVFIPERAKTLDIELSYTPIDTESRLQLTSLDLTIDLDGDGTDDYTTSGDPREGRRTASLDLTTGEFASARGRRWKFNVEGRGVGFGFFDLGILNGLSAEHYPEVMVEYDVSLRLTLDMTKTTPLSDDVAIDPDDEQLEGAAGIVVVPQHMGADTAQWWLGDASMQFAPDPGDGYVLLTTNVYDMTRVEKPAAVADGEGGGGSLVPLIVTLLIVIAAVIVAALVDLRRRRNRDQGQ